MTTKIESVGEVKMELADRKVFPAMAKGFICRCPNCGKGKLFRRYLKVADSCTVCGTELSHQRADDAPAYFTITIIAHLIIPAVFVVERMWEPPYWLHLVIWLPSILAATFMLMPMVKGAIVGLQWALKMHGFGGPVAEEQELSGFSGKT